VTNQRSLKKKLIFTILFIIICSTIIINRDEVGIETWLISKDLKKKITSIDDIIYNKNRDIIAINIIKNFINKDIEVKNVYLTSQTDEGWSYKTTLNYYCNHTKHCKVIYTDLLEPKFSTLNNEPLKIIEFKKYLSGKMIQNIRINTCHNSSNLVIYENINNLVLTCFNESN